MSTNPNLPPPTPEPPGTAPPSGDDRIAVLPDAVTSRVREIKEYPAQGSRGNVFFTGRSEVDGRETEVLVKQITTPSSRLGAIWEFWRSTRGPYVLPLLFTVPEVATDRAGDVHYEVTELLPLGSLFDFVQRHEGSLDGTLARAVLVEMTAALEYLHNSGPDRKPGRQSLIHGDIKPTNVLVRTEDPLDLCLIDFGASRPVEDGKWTRIAGTPAYQAPEAEDAGTEAVDWFSLGITMLEILQGRPVSIDPVSGQEMSKEDLREYLRNGVDLSGIRDRWADLLRGLTHPGRTKRWTGEQVREWLDGKNVRADHYTGPGTKAATTFTFAGAAFDKPDDLAWAMANKWAEAAALLIGHEWSPFLAWAKTLRQGFAEQLRTVKRDHLSNRSQNRRGVDRAVAEVVVLLGPSLPPCFMENRVDVAGLLDLGRRGLGSDPTARGVLSALLETGSLHVYSRLDKQRELAAVAEMWQQWHQTATARLDARFGGVERVPEHGRLPAMLLCAILDRAYYAEMVSRAKGLAGKRKSRLSGWHKEFADAAAKARTPIAVVFHILIVICASMSDRPNGSSPAQAGGVIDSEAIAAQARSRSLEQLMLSPPEPRHRIRSGVRIASRVTRPAIAPARVPRALRPRRSWWGRTVVGAEAVATTVLVPTIAGTAGGAIADAVSPLQGLLTAAVLAVAGACLFAARLLRRPRFAALLRGFWAGAVLGGVVAVIAGGATGSMLGQPSGWSAFWITWAGLIMAFMARGATR